MAISLSFFPIIPVLLLLLATAVQAGTVVYDFNITWVITNPDGAFQRPTIGINNQWPIPIIEATLGDQIIVNVNNQLGNQSTSLHFHGLFQNGTSHMDGPAQVSQCPIMPGSSFTYNFTVRVRCWHARKQLILTVIRPLNQGHTGITLTPKVNTPMDFVDR